MLKHTFSTQHKKGKSSSQKKFINEAGKSHFCEEALRDFCEQGVDGHTGAGDLVTFPRVLNGRGAPCVIHLSSPSWWWWRYQTMATHSLRLKLEAISLLLLLLTGPALQCGPGRGSGRRRGPRKMTPLVFKQHVPNVSENTLGASGLAEGKISKHDPRFKDLVVNHNPDIIFKDEEGTGADRIMTQRCKDKLNTLAISVMNQWQGVKLRVTEAWDEDGHHAKDSLHYEGRAVDITTSDRDRSKYGMLARLAVEAGFDWVLYESRGHIHCSVKSDSSIAIKTGGCFAGSDLVQLPNGQWKTMSAVLPGDQVLALTDAGRLDYAEIMLFLDRNEEETTAFVTIETEHNNSISLTPSHLIHVIDSKHVTSAHVTAGDVNTQVTFASNVQIDQYIFINDGQMTSKPSRVTKMTLRADTGVYAPLTKHGTIVVGGVVASCYAIIDSQEIAHVALLPIRFLHYVTSFFRRRDLTQDTNELGIHWYAKMLHSLAPYVIHPDQLFTYDRTSALN